MKVRTKIKNVKESGHRTGWSKLVTKVHPNLNDGWAFEGEFLPDDKEIELPIGGIIVQKNPAGSVKRGYHVGECLIVKGDGSLEPVTDREYDWYKDFLSFRDLVASCVNFEKDIRH